MNEKCHTPGFACRHCLANQSFH